ncbi:MAG: TonB-dependent receptor [Tepidisphaeraceae bacterium]|jgi:iron complex outermembrane receptor protein
MISLNCRQRTILISCIVLAAASTTCLGQTLPTTRPKQDVQTKPSSQPSGPDLTNLSLEDLMNVDLMNVEVTSVSKAPQKIADAPAAVFVIGQDDIARSGLQSIPELLRLVPGLDVAQINADTWAIGSRGFNQQYDRSLLVLMDGRTLYNPGTSGVYWDEQDYILQDLDRIEVIRGPGSTLWGANAVDGVISIKSKNAADTQGWLVDSEAGSIGESESFRYGGKLDSDTYYRIYGKYRSIDSFDDYDNSNIHDPWQSSLGGLRIDHNGSRDSYTVEAQAYNDHRTDQYTDPSTTPPFSSVVTGNYDASDDYALARWTHTFSDDSDLMVQAYYDYLNFSGSTTTSDPVNTFDLDAQDRFAVGNRQEIIWGGGARIQSDNNISNNGVVVFNPTDSNYNRYNVFAQDDVAIVPDRLHVVLGSKVEDDAFTGFEYEPTIRGIWTPNDKNSIWAAFSRAIRTPSGFEDHATLITADFPVTGGVGQSELVGNPNLQAEDLNAYDAGYRFKPTESVSLDADGFYYDYEDIITSQSLAPVASGFPPLLILPDQETNNARANSYGLEFTANWQVTPAWRLSGSYTWLRTNFSGGNPIIVSYLKGGSPDNQAQLHSYYDVTRDLEFNASVYYVDALLLGNIPSYVRLDLGTAWHPTPTLRISVGVQNLLDSHHVEFSSPNGDENSAEVPRTVYGEISYKF